MGKGKKRRKKAMKRLGVFLGGVVAETAGSALYRGLEVLSEKLDAARKRREAQDAEQAAH